MIELPDLTLEALRDRYLAKSLRPRDLLKMIRQAIREDSANPIWIAVLSEHELQPYLARLEKSDPADLPLYGVPFAIKDNIDLAGIPTTAGCREYSYTPPRSAQVVQRLLDAGAVPVGKTNMDQFATGLVGTRSPYGAVHNAFHDDYISGGSSSGSAVAVANGLASFALGTDTAGSGRVPAAFNNLVGVKPSRGLLSTRGVVPACRTLDCVCVFALQVEDACTVTRLLTEFDAEDPYARRQQPSRQVRQVFRFGVPRTLEFLGDGDAERLYRQAVSSLEQLGGEAEEIDFSPFREAARLLYEGPWVAERYAAIEDFIRAHADTLDPTVRDIILAAETATAVAGFKAGYRLQVLARQAQAPLEMLDFILIPTAATIYTLDQVAADPVGLNSRLGYYTNFMNLLDCAAVAVPAGFGSSGLPYGVTLFSHAFTDASLAEYARRLQQLLALPMGATGRHLPASEPPAGLMDDGQATRLVVCGAHMSGLSLNHQLTDRGGRLLRRTTTAPRYGLYALPGGPPARPGLIRQLRGGAAIDVEVWSIPSASVGSFLAGIPAPLGLGSVELADGSWHKGFICEAYIIEQSEDISALGSWRRYLQTRQP